ncbi:hypothetical protein ACVCIC_28890 [Burkholderia glumae]|uniref:hypothetical protein n=1 Tax=Burkholderia TaxID=32008 RepID=UPI001177C833|nr:MULTISPECIES: hypothetical protein [Burkholderia]MCM2481852.1 hypothetical protein [Burkholderia glumae]MCM2508005.1 hypothetical protein [Burkholderia glumae]
MNSKMLFVSLDVVLCAVGAGVEISPSAGLPDPGEPAWMQNIHESYYRYSKAAGLLDHHLVTEQSERLPRWFDTSDGTGYPRPSDAARDDGMALMLEQARWYPRWLKFNREFRARSTTFSSRWGGPPTEADYGRDCPYPPVSTERFARRVHEIGFDASAIIALLDHLAIPHTLKLPEASEAVKESEARLRNPGADEPLPVINEGLASEGANLPGMWGNSTAGRGRKSPIDKAIAHARILAGGARDDTDTVRAMLIKIASEYPERFPPMSAYRNGQVLYWHNGKERPYTTRALAAYLARRKLQPADR